MHLPGGRLVGIEGLQRLQPLQIVEERGAHIGVLAPVFLEHAGRAHGDHADDDHDERRTNEQHDGCGHIDRRKHGKQRKRGEYSVEQLRHELLVETLHLVHAFTGELHNARRARLLTIRRAEHEQLAIQRIAQAEFDTLGRLGAEP